MTCFLFFVWRKGSFLYVRRNLESRSPIKAREAPSGATDKIHTGAATNARDRLDGLVCTLEEFPAALPSQQSSQRVFTGWGAISCCCLYPVYIILPISIAYHHLREGFPVSVLI